MKPIDVLRKAKELISDPARWTKGAAARNYVGRAVGTGRRQGACQWCSYGAVKSVAYDNGGSLTDAASIMDRAASMFGADRLDWADDDLRPIAAYNDHPSTTHAEVLALFDKAIQLAEAAADNA